MPLTPEKRSQLLHEGIASAIEMEYEIVLSGEAADEYVLAHSSEMDSQVTHRQDPVSREALNQTKTVIVTSSGNIIPVPNFQPDTKE